MAYTLTDDQKGWFAALTVLTSKNMSDKTTITDNELDGVEADFANTPQAAQVTAFKAWVKGGVRPPNPH